VATQKNGDTCRWSPKRKEQKIKKVLGWGNKPLLRTNKKINEKLPRKNHIWGNPWSRLLEKAKGQIPIKKKKKQKTKGDGKKGKLCSDKNLSPPHM